MARPFLRRVLLTTAALVAAVVVFLALTLPPRPLVVDVSGWTPPAGVTVVKGVIHVHTVRSDGGGTLDDVAAAAARAGLAFVVVTDHGDATRAPDPPAYRSGVLCLDGVEISTTGGHYVALDMPAAPYPLGGDPRDVVEDVARLGGFGVAAHPTSPKPALAWTAWDARFDGMEWLNADSEWRDETWRTLWRAPFDYLARPAPALASLLDRPVSALARWDGLTAHRVVVGLAGADAHGRIGLGQAGPYGDVGWLQIPIPSYAASFETFATRLELPAPLGGGAAADARAVYDAIRHGRAFTGIDALAGPVRVDFTATSGGVTARMGETLEPRGPVTVHLRTAIPAGGEVVLIQDGREVASQAAAELTHEATVASAVFRAEVRLAAAPGTPPVPWIVTNPIYVGPRAPGPTPPPRPGIRETVPLYANEPQTGDWRVELDPASRAAVNVVPNVGGSELAFRYGLRGAPADGQYAALVRHVEGGLAGADRLVFRGRASRPMRVEVELRAPGGVEGMRWERSIYLDTEPRDITVFFDDLRPVGPTAAPAPDLSAVDSLLFVVDTTHTAPGTAGVVWVDDVGVGKPQ